MNAELLRFATTPRQAEVMQAVIDNGSGRAAARELGITHQSVNEVVKKIKTRAAKQGYSPEHSMTQTVPDGFHVKGVSTYYDQDGNVRGQWVKSNADREALESEIREVISELVGTVPKARPIKAKHKGNEDLLNVHILTDYHLGMNAWHEDAGEDWDISIAEQLLVDWFSTAIKQAPNAHTGVLSQLGDFLHWDGLEAVTPAHKHVLDADTRFQKVVRVAIRSLRAIVRMMLDKYPHVHLIMADANHDPASSAWLREVFAAFYEDEPRVTVDNSADTYYCYEHGLTSIFFHHGHKRRPSNIDDVFAAKFREVFGRTKFSYAHMGHMHHDDRKETNLMTVEQHRTMAAKDAYASLGGWLSGRGAPVITYHKQFGEVGRQILTPEMVQ